MNLRHIACTLLLAVVGTAGAAETVLRLAHAGASGSSQHQAALKMAEIVKTRSNGALRIEVYPDAQLGADARVIPAMQAGDIDMVLAGTPNFVGIAPKLTQVDLPFSFGSASQAHRELDSHLYNAAMFRQLAEQGVKPLAFWEVGFRIITSNKGFVSKPEDFKGLKLRVVGNPQQQAFFRALGAEVVNLPLGEVAQAVRDGRIDAQDHPLPISHSSRLYEVQKYWTLTRHAYTALLLVVNRPRFEALPAAQQAILQEAALAGRDFQRRANAQAEAGLIADLKAHGVQVQEHAELRSLRALASQQNAAFYAQQFSSR